MNYSPNNYVQTERGAKLCELIRSNLYLAIAIIMSVNLGLSILNVLLIGQVASAVTGLILPVLTLVGVWMLRSAATRGFRTSPFGFLKVRTISLMVVFIIGIVSLLILMAFSGTIVDVIKAAENGGEVVIGGAGGQSIKLDAETRESILKALDTLNSYYPDATQSIHEYGQTIIIIVAAAAIAVCALALVGAIKANGVINKMKNTIVFGFDEPIKTGYLTAILYVFAGLMLIYTVASLFTGLFSVWQIGNLLEIALMVLAAMFYGKVSEIMR